MAAIATINPLNQFFALNGSPLNNGKLYFGEANKDPEQFPVQLYWDAAGLVPALQPIRTTSGYPARSGSPAILYCNSKYSLRVRQSNDVQVFYLAEAGSDASTPFSGFSPSNLTPSYVSANSFTVSGDQRAAFPPGLRVQASVTSGTVYGTVTSAVYGALTTVTLAMDSGDALDAGLSAVNLGLSPVDDALPRGVFPTIADVLPSTSGLTYSNNALDAVNDIDIAAGVAMDSTGVAVLRLASTITKRLDAAWAVGTNQGGLDTGAIGNSDYYIWLIGRADMVLTDVLFSLSSTAPTMPANYTRKRLIGWFKRVGGTIVAFHTYEKEGGGIDMNWDVPTLDINLPNTLTTARRTDAVKVPLNFSVVAHLNVSLIDTSASVIWICCPDQADAAPSATVAPLGNASQLNAGNNNWNGQMFIRTSATGTIAARSGNATIDTYAVSTMGFAWSRRN